MASAKILQFLRGDKPRVLALTGPSGCGKHHAISEAAQQANVAAIHHDLAQGVVEWSKLGTQQLASVGLRSNVHVVSNATDGFLRDFAFVKKVQAQIILVTDDAGACLRASVPVVRMQPLSSDAMAKKLFLDMEWPAEEALRAARAACGNWHQLRAQQQFETTAGGEPEQSNPRDVCSTKDERLANEPPCFIANRLLNGTAPESCPLDATTISWVEANMPMHCDGDLEVLAQKQELLATSATGLLAGSPTAEELFTRAAGFRSKRMHYQHGLCKNPCEKNDAAVQEIAESFKRRRTTFIDGLKERARREESGSGSRDTVTTKSGATKPKPRVKAKAKARTKMQP